MTQPTISIFSSGAEASHDVIGDRIVAWPDHETGAKMCIHSDIQILHDSALFNVGSGEVNILIMIILHNLSWIGVDIPKREKRLPTPPNEEQAFAQTLPVDSMCFQYAAPVRPLRGAAAD